MPRESLLAPFPAGQLPPPYEMLQEGQRRWATAKESGPASWFQGSTKSSPGPPDVQRKLQKQTKTIKFYLNPKP